MRQETSCCADRSDIGHCVILDRATVVGRGRDSLFEHVWLSVERPWDVPIMLPRAGSNSKEAHLTCSKLIQF